ncbi:hypothetical protein KII98_03065 [Leuconostoc gelidum subsp. gasicomitatum]|uniref:hypothetical protein n=1 Tax=Leuconostoc gasicomitatum TaxID=115778 RepID=UPI001CC7B953|nr:hypothetical protein [Leuconostoc gasicomitatum]MBZ5952929.1 hypothetical protein [Leuconostoc gasicomitatum]
MKKLDSNKISKLSDDMFEYTLVNHVDPESIAEKSDVDINDVLRLQSENPFVSEKSFDKVRSYISSVLSNSSYYDNRLEINISSLDSFDFRSDGYVSFKTVTNKKADNDSQFPINLLSFFLSSNSRNNNDTGQSYITNINFHQTSSTEQIRSKYVQNAYV